MQRGKRERARWVVLCAAVLLACGQGWVRKPDEAVRPIYPSTKNLGEEGRRRIRPLF